MRAALYEAGSTTLAIGDVDIDDPAPGRVRVRVHHCGLCHSDYTALHSTYGASPPLLGHDAAGVPDPVGGVGLAVVQGARAAGAAQIIASDPLHWRRDAAASMGATTVLDPGTDDVLAATRDLTSVGADYAFECAGVAALAAVGVEGTRAGGTTVLVGAPPLEGKLELDPLVLFGISEKKLMGCFLGSCNSLRDIPRLVAMWRAGQLDLEALVTARRPLDEIND